METQDDGVDISQLKTYILSSQVEVSLAVFIMRSLFVGYASELTLFPLQGPGPCRCRRRRAGRAGRAGKKQEPEANQIQILA